MSKPKAQTIQQRFGFLDHELSTPKHDEIMLWLDDCMDTVASNFLRDQDMGIAEAVRFYSENGISESVLKSLDKPNPNLPIKVVSKIWEKPITTQQSKGYGNKYTVGFVDMALQYRLPVVALEGIKWPSFGSRGPEIVGDLRWSVRYENKVAYFEVKPEVRSLGELMRQIRMYQTYVDDGVKFAVVSPDDRLKKQIERQGIIFVPYPSAHHTIE